ncbi:hypothetical protein FRC01_009334 [Tulasnella sp. 417]|nr:hypothetical protein FRC01_009334 [Tulasnella sp. 417]
MAVQPPPTAPPATVLDKDALSKLKRPEIQALCKANNLRAIGTTGSLIDSLTAYFETLTVGKRDTKAHVTTKTTSRLWKSSPQKPPVPTSQDVATPTPTPGSTSAPALTRSTLKSKPSVESLSAKPGVRRPSLRVPSTRSRLSSLTSLSPMVTETDADACTTTEASSAVPDHQLLSPANAAAPPRNAISPTPSNRSFASSVRPVRKLTESTTTKPKTAPTGPKAAGKSTQSFPTTAQGLSASTSAKPSSAPTRRTSITPSVAPQARSPQPLRTRLSSHTSLAPSSVVSPVRSVQLEIAELSASLKAVEDARVEQVAALTERIAAQDVALQAQNDLVCTLQQTVKEMHELLVSTRQDLLEACKVDVASCMSQSSILTQAVSELEKRMDAVEVEVFDEGGKVEGLMKEMGDVDVAMASERDRVSCLETRLVELEVKVDEVMGESAPTSATSASFRIRKNSKKLSMSGPGVVRQRKQSVVRDSSESSPQDSMDLFSRDRRLSRASISASIHTSTPLSPVPSGAVAFPSTTKRPMIKPPFTGTKQEFKFPPPPQKSTESRSRTVSATGRRTKTPEPLVVDPSPFGGKGLHRTPPAYGDDGEDDPDPQSPADEDGLEDRTMRLDPAPGRHHEEESSEDERVTPPIPPRPTRTSTTKRIVAPPPARTLPSILVNNEKPENSNSSSLASVLSDGAVSVSISDLDVAGGITTDDDGMARRSRGIRAEELHDSLLHQPQPSFGGLTTDDEFDADGADEMSHTVILSSVPPPRNKNQRT